MTLDPVLLFLFPIILIVIALVFDSLIFSFCGGVVAVFVGIEFMETIWIGVIFVGLGVYFMLISVFAEEDG